MSTASTFSTIAESAPASSPADLVNAGGSASGAAAASEAPGSRRARATWQAAFPWSSGSRGGSSSAHTAIACGQRGANGQPVGGEIRLGGRPGM